MQGEDSAEGADVGLLLQHSRSGDTCFDHDVKHLLRCRSEASFQLRFRERRFSGQLGRSYLYNTSAREECVLRLEAGGQGRDRHLCVGVTVTAKIFPTAAAPEAELERWRAHAAGGWLYISLSHAVDRLTYDGPVLLESQVSFSACGSGSGSGSAAGGSDRAPSALAAPALAALLDGSNAAPYRIEGEGGGVGVWYPLQSRERESILLARVRLRGERYLMAVPPLREPSGESFLLSERMRRLITSRGQSSRTVTLVTAEGKRAEVQEFLLEMHDIQQLTRSLKSPMRESETREIPTGLGQEAMRLFLAYLSRGNLHSAGAPAEDSLLFACATAEEAPPSPPPPPGRCAAPLAARRVFRSHAALAELVAFAEMYGLRTLQGLCEGYLSLCVCTENLSEMLTLCCRHAGEGTGPLMPALVDFICRNGADLQFSREFVQEHATAAAHILTQLCQRVNTYYTMGGPEGKAGGGPGGGGGSAGSAPGEAPDPVSRPPDPVSRPPDPVSRASGPVSRPSGAAPPPPQDGRAASRSPRAPPAARTPSHALESASLGPAAAAASLGRSSDRAAPAVGRRRLATARSPLSSHRTDAEEDSADEAARRPRASPQDAEDARRRVVRRLEEIAANHPKRRRSDGGHWSAGAGPMGDGAAVLVNPFLTAAARDGGASEPSEAFAIMAGSTGVRGGGAGEPEAWNQDLSEEDEDDEDDEDDEEGPGGDVQQSATTTEALDRLRGLLGR